MRNKIVYHSFPLVLLQAKVVGYSKWSYITEWNKVVSISSPSSEGGGSFLLVGGRYLCHS